MNKSEKIIYNQPLSKKCIYRYRYTDNISGWFNGSVRQLPNISFTTELEQNNSISYLNLKISRFDNRYDFSIFSQYFSIPIPTTNSNI